MSATLALPARDDGEAGLGRALLLAVIVEGLVLAGLAAMTASAPPPPPPIPIRISLAVPPAPKPAVTPKPRPKPIPHPPPKHAVAPKPAPTRPLPKAVPPKPAPLPPSPVAAPVPPPPPAPLRAAPLPPPPPAPDPQVRDSYLGRVKAAIQAAVRYPAAARMMGEQGRVEVAFALKDGVADGVRVLVPGIAAGFNDAALAAVRAARVPAPPPALAGKRMNLTLWVEFKLDRGY